MLLNAVLTKIIQLKDTSNPILILNTPEEFEEIVKDFDIEVHKEVKLDMYLLVQIFGSMQKEIESLGIDAIDLSEDGFLWASYPKKSSKKYKNLDCSRDTLVTILGDYGYESVGQVSVTDNFSALRYHKVENIKKPTRSEASTEVGKERISEK